MQGLTGMGGGATGLSTGSYYVYRIDDDIIQLGETLYDVKKFPPTVVAITAATTIGMKDLVFNSASIKS